MWRLMIDKKWSTGFNQYGPKWFTFWRIIREFHFHILLWLHLKIKKRPTKKKTSWWFQPIWKICSSNWMISPGRCKNKKWLKAPPRKIGFAPPHEKRLVVHSHHMPPSCVRLSRWLTRKSCNQGGPFVTIYCESRGTSFTNFCKEKNITLDLPILYINWLTR